MRFLLPTLHFITRYKGFSAFLIVIAGTTAFLVQNVLAWSPEQRIPWATSFELAPAVEVDDTGMVHVVWMVGDAQTKPFYYARGYVNATRTGIDWIEGPQHLGVSAYHYGPMAIRTSGTTVHILVQDGSQPRENRHFAYFRNEAQGAPGYWAAEYASALCEYDPDLAIDSQGGVHGVCTYDGTAKYFYRPPGQAMGSGGWSGGNLVNPDGITRDTRITIANYAGQEFVNIFFCWKPDDDWNLIHAYGGLGAVSIARLFVSDVIGTVPGTISADPSTGYLVGGVVSGRISTGYYTTLFLSNDGGANWASPGGLNQSGGWWYNTRSMVSRNGVAHVLSEQWNYDIGSRDPEKRIFYQSYGYLAGQLSGIQQLSSGHSTQPELGFNSAASAAVWITDNTNGVTYSIGNGDGSAPAPTSTPVVAPTSTPLPGPTSTPLPGPTDTPVPSGNKPVFEITVGHGNHTPTRSNYQNVPVAITFLLDTTADQYKVWEEGTSEPTSYQSLTMTSDTSAQVSVNLTNPNATDNFACSTHVVNVKLKNSTSGLESETVPGIVQIDSGVDVTFDARNPNPGDPDQTSEPYYVLDIQANQGECSYIKNVLSIEQTAPATTTVTNNNTTTLRVVNGDVELTRLPLISDVNGEYTIAATITDGSGWEDTFQDTITLNNTQLQIAASGSMEVHNPETNQQTTTSDSDKVDLAFLNIQVTENGYSQNDSGIWGICATNRLASDTTAPPTSWEDMQSECTSTTISSQESSGDGYNLTVDEWNLTAGFPTGTTLESGTALKIYACVMNGATCAEQVFEGNVTLTDNIRVQGDIATYLPIIMK
jgi:hypothetical protein